MTTDTGNIKRGILAHSLRVRLIYWTYYAFILWIPIETIYIVKGEEGAVRFTISRLLGSFLFGLALINKDLCFKKFPAAFWMLFWYLMAYTISVFWIPLDFYPDFIINQLTLLQMTVLLLISLNLFTDLQFQESLLRFYGWWTGLVATGMIFGILGGELAGAAGRISIVDQNPNVAAELLALGAICIIGNVKKVMSKCGILSGFAISILVIAILQTGSRGGVIGLLAGVFSFLICVGKKSHFLTRAMVLSFAIGVLGYLVIQEFQAGTVTAVRFEQAWGQGDTAGRTIIWDTAWALFLEKPFFGHGGYYNFIILGSYLNAFIMDTHNLFLAVLTEVGLVGALPFIAAFFYTMKRSWSYGKETGNALPFALMCTLFASNLSGTGYHQKMFWVFFAVAISSGLQLEGNRKVIKSEVKDL